MIQYYVQLPNPLGTVWTYDGPFATREDAEKRRTFLFEFRRYRKIAIIETTDPSSLPR